MTTLYRSNLATVKQKIKIKSLLLQQQCPWFPEKGFRYLGEGTKQRKTYYTLHEPEKVPVNVFALWNMIRNVLDPHHEAVN